MPGQGVQHSFTWQVVLEGRGEATVAPQNLPAKPAAGLDKQMTPHPLEDSNTHHIRALAQEFDVLTTDTVFQYAFFF